MRYRCDYYGLLRGIDYYNGAEWRWDSVEQCPTAPTYYVCVDQAEVRVTHLVDLCDEHDKVVRELAGWRSSEPKQVFA